MHANLELFTSTDCAIKENYSFFSTEVFTIFNYSCKNAAQYKKYEKNSCCLIGAKLCAVKIIIIHFLKTRCHLRTSIKLNPGRRGSATFLAKLKMSFLCMWVCVRPNPHLHTQQIQRTLHIKRVEWSKRFFNCARQHKTPCWCLPPPPCCLFAYAKNTSSCIHSQA